MTTDLDRSSKIKIGLNLDSLKADIKAELDGIGAASGPKQRLKAAVVSAHRLAASEDPLTQLKCFIYVVAALFHHERYGGLTVQQIRRLSNLAYATLRFLGIHPYSSRLSVLYSDLHLALSQCYRRGGRHWKAAWEQQLSTQLSDANKGSALQELAFATRTLRLGHADIALVGFENVERDERAPHLFEKARLGRVRALRLMKRLEEARSLIKESLMRENITAPFRLEMQWDEICCACSETKDFSRMLQAVQKGRSHDHPSYVLEAYLWCYSAPQRRWVERLPSLGRLTSGPRKTKANPGFILAAVRQLVACHDVEQPTAIRLRELGDLLEQSHRIITVDRELLLWVASARWLARVKAYTLAELALRQYTELSSRICRGPAQDVLGVAHDLLDRVWRQPLGETA